MKLYALCAGGCLSLGLLSTAAHAGFVTVYQDDFSTGGVQLYENVMVARTGGSIVSSQGYASYGFGDAMYALKHEQAGTVLEFSISQLPTHSFLSIGGMLAVINSWDGNEGGDFLSVYLDNQLLHTSTFSLFNPTVSDFGQRLTPEAGADLFALPAGYAAWYDQAYDFTNLSSLTNIAHTASEATLRFVAHGQGWQGFSDESFGLGQLSVLAGTNTSPSSQEPIISNQNIGESSASDVPASGVGGALAALLLGGVMRRRQRQR